jgi:hypothetical protein
MKKLLLILSLLAAGHMMASDLYYYADTQKTPLFGNGYSQTHHAELYATSPSPRARKMFAPDRIIVCLSDKSIDAAGLAERYGLKVMRRMPVSGEFWLFATPEGEALSMANAIYERERGVGCAYPDWQYVR